VAEGVCAVRGRGLVVPIFKAGDAKECSNYRGITLCCCVSKVYEKVLNARVMAFLDAEELVEEQGGFRSGGRGPVDHVVALDELLQKRKRMGKRTVSVFVDLSKAYDTVWRDGMWWRLLESGVRGKMWRVLRAMYVRMESAVLVNGEESESFELGRGVRQGSALSPILFTCFINGLAKEMKACGIGGVEVDEETRLRLLLFVDDIVLLAESEEEMQKMLEVFGGLVEKWRLRVNVAKSKVLGCGGRGDGGEDEAELVLNGVVLERVRKYKYLGVWFTEDGGWKETVTSKGEKAAKLSKEMRRWWLCRKGVSVHVKFEVWKAMVLSGLLYGSEAWWPDKTSVKKLEAAQVGVVKAAAGACVSTASVAVRGEVGTWSVGEMIEKRKLVWWWKVCHMGKERLVRRVLEMEAKCVRKGRRRKLWSEHVQGLLEKYGLGKMRPEEMEESEWRSEVEKRMSEVVEKGWRDEVGRMKSLELYGAVKEKLEMEKYMSRNGRKEISVMFRARCGSLGLSEVLSRRRGVASICQCCDSGNIENVEHFLAFCSAFKGERQKWVKQMRERGYSVVPESIPKIVLGMKVPGVSPVRSEVSSLCLSYLLSLWEGRSKKLYGSIAGAHGCSDTKA